MKQKRITNFVFIAIVSAVGIFLIIMNVKNVNFWSASFIQILTLVVTAALSFFFVQKLTDKR